MDNTRGRSPPRSSLSPMADGGTAELIAYTLNWQKSTTSGHSMQDLIDHTLGVRRLPPSETSQGGGSSGRSSSTEEAAWNRKREHELERLKHLKLTDVGIAAEGPLEAACQVGAGQIEMKPNRGTGRRRFFFGLGR